MPSRATSFLPITSRRLVVLGVVIAASIAACSAGASPVPFRASALPVAPSDASGSRAPAARLTIFAAASLKRPLETVKAAYEAANPGTTIALSTDSSSALATQIEQGAPADVFLAADTTNPARLVDSGFSTGPAVELARNELAVIVPSANPARITSPRDLARPGVKVIAAGDDVPITTYAGRLVVNLAKESGYPSDFAAAYAANIASKEDNVAAVVAKVELGEGDAGIVYATDAKASTRVTTIHVPDTANVPATYAGVVLRASPNVVAARTFLDWLAGPDGQAILASLGFMAPS